MGWPTSNATHRPRCCTCLASSEKSHRRCPTSCPGVASWSGLRKRSLGRVVIRRGDEKSPPEAPGGGSAVRSLVDVGEKDAVTGAEGELAPVEPASPAEPTPPPPLPPPIPT